MGTLEPIALRPIVDAIGDPRQLEALFKAVEAIGRTHFRTMLFTILAYRPESRGIERI